MVNNLTYLTKDKPKAPMLVYESVQIKKVMDQAIRVAKDPGCMVVTILGESGVMKTVLARWIAYYDIRNGKVIEIDSASIPKNLLESILYGRKKGAHTDARETEIGLVEEADGGVCIFNDINHIPISHQNKLAQFIDSGVYRRVGCNIRRQADAKRIATTNVSWKKAVHNGLLTKDLYNRLNDFRIHIPPLRDRKEDIKILSDHFLAQKTNAIGRTEIKLSSEVKDLFMQYHWPNNVRELKQTINSSIIRCDGNKIQLEHLPEGFGEGSEVENQTTCTPDESQIILSLLGKLLLKNVRFNLNKTSTPASDLDDKEEELIDYMINNDNPIIYRRDYQRDAGLSKSNANRLIKELVQRGLLVKRSGGSGTHYTISLQRLIKAKMKK